MSKRRRPSTTVFPDLINACAFVDTCRFSGYGKILEIPLADVELGQAKPIFSEHSYYKTAKDGIVKLTGNPFQLRYNRTEPYLPPATLTMWSETIPLTCGEVMTVKNAVSEPGFSLLPSRTEFTFDLENVPFDTIITHAFSNSRRRAVFGKDAAEDEQFVPKVEQSFLDDDDSEEDREERQREQSDASNTWYLGSPKSATEVCIYEKKEGVVRIEFVLRRPFLRKHHIDQPADILQFNTFDFSERLRFEEFEPEAFQRTIDKRQRPGTWKHDILNHWAGRVEELARAMRRYGRVNTRQILQPHELTNLIAHMQRNFVW